MTQISHYIMMAALCLLASCAKPEIIDPQEDQPGPHLHSDPVTVTVTLPEFPEATKLALDPQNLDPTWNAGSKLMVVGLDEAGKAIASSEFEILPEDAGKKSASFEGYTIIGAYSYLFYNMTPELRLDKNRMPVMSYKNMCSSERGDRKVLDNTLFLSSAAVEASTIDDHEISLALRNSILRLNVRSFWANLGEIQSIDWICNEGTEDEASLTLKYTGATVVEGQRKPLDNLYFCFDPEQMGLRSGQKMTFCFHGTESLTYSCSAVADAGKTYEAGQVYEINVSTDPADQEAITSWNEPAADLLDIVFEKNGDARDISDAGNLVHAWKGEKLSVRKPEGTDAYAAYFANDFAGTATGNAYTFADYAWRPQLEDGYSMEAYLMCNVPPTGLEAKALSSTKEGGTAILITQNKHLGFLYNGNQSGTKDWRFVESDVVPVPGRWYHVLGTWDQKTGVARCYIDGKLAKETNYGPVQLYHNLLGENSYMTIGGNSSLGSAAAPALNGGWNGAVASARVYSRALTAEEVAVVYSRVQKVTSAEPPVNPDVPQEEISADLLDVVFAADGSARDASPAHRNIQHISGTGQTTVYSELYKRQMARFNHIPGTSPQGYYRMDYSSDQTFMNKLKDGHSIEIVFSAGQDMSGFDEVKMFCSHEGGGTGMMTKGGVITFLPNVSTNGASAWCWAKSDIIPIPGRYYHAVGVWDKVAAKAILYVDGVKVGEGVASGELNLPSASARWFGIGVDSSNGAGTNAWNGDLVLARIYDQVLTPEQVSALYDQVKVVQPDHPISNVEYLKSCIIAPGYKYHIYGNGLAAGDQVLFHPVAGGKDLVLPAQAASNELIVTIPANMVTGKYKLSILHGETVAPVGEVHMVISTDKSKITKAKTVAHRCYHNSGVPENSLAGFKEADKRGFWGAEIDVQLTTDNVVLVNHNSSYPSDPFGRKIWTHTYAQLDDIKLSNGEPLPKLEYLLEAMNKDVKNLTLVLEIKIDGGVPAGYTDRMLDACIGLVRKYGLEDRVVWISFNYESICKGLVQRLPGCKVMSLTSKQPSTCKKDGIFGMDYGSNSFSSNPGWIGEGHELGLLSNVWTVNNEAMMKNFILRGVDFITTDQPDTLQKLLKKPYITE